MKAIHVIGKFSQDDIIAACEEIIEDIKDVSRKSQKDKVVSHSATPNTSNFQFPTLEDVLKKTGDRNKYMQYSFREYWVTKAYNIMVGNKKRCNR